MDRPGVTASRSMLVQVDPNTDGDGDAEAAEHDSGPSGPAPPQSAVAGIDVFERVPSDPDGWDARQDTEDQAQQSEGERVSCARVDRVRGDMGVRVGAHPGVRAWREVARRCGVG